MDGGSRAGKGGFSPGKQPSLDPLLEEVLSLGRCYLIFHQCQLLLYVICLIW